MLESMRTVEEEVNSCSKCGLCSGRKQAVFGCGNEKASVMFVGEAPGEREDIEGLPFVGRSGQLLDLYLKYIDLDRKDIYITNVVKCRPPQNRDPKPEECDMCLPYLRRQFKIIKPKIIVCLGRVAAQRLITPAFKVTSMHGGFFKKNDIWMMGTFHPSALLRYDRNKDFALDDFIQLRDKISDIRMEEEWET